MGDFKTLETVFGIESAEMTSEDSDWISNALEEAGVKLVEFSALDILYTDEAMLATAMNYGDPLYIYLAVLHLRDLRILRGSSEAWLKFGEACLAHSQARPH